MAFPEKTDLARLCGSTTRTDELEKKIANEAPFWKMPFFWWMQKLGGYPFDSETVSGAFDFNRAPFFQSFPRGECRAVAESSSVLALRCERAASLARYTSRWERKAAGQKRTTIQLSSSCPCGGGRVRRGIRIKQQLVSILTISRTSEISTFSTRWLTNIGDEN
jgi:hypothetical protein